MKKALLLLLAPVVLASCTTDIVERTVIDELRILAVQSEPAEIQPGESAFVHALVVDPGQFRPLSHVWSVCNPDPVVGLESCEDPGRLVVVSTNDSVYPLAIDAEFLAGLTPEQQEEGRDLFVVLDVSAEGPGTERATAFKRIRVSTSSVPNTNPQLDAFSVNGVSDPESYVVAGAEVEVRARPTPESRELYDPGDGEIMEEMRYSWWTTGGELEKSVSFGGQAVGGGTTKWKAESPATLWVVLRDPRGGATWAEHRVIEP